MYMVRNFVSTRVDITIRNDQIIITISSHTYSRPQIAYHSTFSSIENIFSLRKKKCWIKEKSRNSLDQTCAFYMQCEFSTTKPSIPYHWHSSYYAVTHVRN